MTARSPAAPWTGAADNGNNRRKRLRISRACDTCRRRKERCDGTEPSCRRCTTAGRTCSYYPSRRRGLPPGYVRSLEILLGLLFYSSRGAADLIRSVIHGETCETVFDLAPPVESLLDTWRESSAFEQLQRVLTSAAPADDDDLYLQDLNHKWTSNFNALPRAPKQTGSRGCNASSSETTGPGQPLPEPHACRPRTALSPVDGSSPVLPVDWPRLVNLYLINTHTWLPIVQKFTLYRCANMLSHSASSDHADGAMDVAPGEVASLWAVLALGSYQADLPKTQYASSQPLSTDLGHRVSSSADLYATAKVLLLRDSSGFQEGHVHASLILALRDIALGAWTDAWLFVCRALFIASTIGITPQGGHGPKPTLNDAQKRLFIGCFVLDGIVASALSIRPHLHKEDLERVGGVFADGLEEWEPWGPGWGPLPNCEHATNPGRLLSTFNSLGGLVCLLKDYDHSCGNPELRNKLIQDFMDWQQRLPSSVAPAASTMPSIDDAIISESAVRGQMPPHSLHMNLLAGTLYTMLEAPTSCISPTVSCLNAARLATTSTLHRTLKSMESISKETTLPILVRCIPTIQAFIKLLDRDPTLSSTEFLLPPGYVDGSRYNRQCAQPPPLLSTTTCFGSLDHAQSEEVCRPRAVDIHAISTTGPGQSQSSADADPAQAAPMYATDCPNPPTVLPDSVEAAAMEPTSHDGSFDRLSILEMANWNTMSVDFMENLGVPCGDVTPDISSLFFSGDDT